MFKGQQANLTKARQAASGLIKKYAITAPDEIVVEDIAMARGALVIEGGLKGCEARLVRAGTDGVIRVRDDIPESGRKRFAVAHELGHWELHAALCQLYACSEADLRDYKGSVPEIEANAFAGELLMPTSLFRPTCRTFDPGIEAIKELAGQFGTTLTSTAVRFIEESKENCVVVFSEDSKVKWWKAKNAGVWIEPRHRIHQDSATCECFHDGVDLTTMQKVPTEAWFENASAKRVLEVYEQAMRLGSYTTVLSLLWLLEG
jgi:Zn-dependent peptidase ImmA (M78 family)